MSDSDLELLTNNTPVLTLPHHPPKHFHNTTSQFGKLRVLYPNSREEFPGIVPIRNLDS